MGRRDSDPQRSSANKMITIWAVLLIFAVVLIGVLEMIDT